MPQSNVLQRSLSLHSFHWREHEIAQWSASIRHPLALLVLLGTGLRLLVQLFTFTYSALLTPVALGSFAASLAFLLSPRTARDREINTAFLLLCQGYCVVMGTAAYPNCFALWCVNSTVVFCLYEIPSFTERWMVVALMARQFAMWQAVAMYLGKTESNAQFPYYMTVGLTLMVLLLANEARTRTIERYRFSDAVIEQEERMKSILQAIPEGLVVLTADCAVPCFNSRLSEILPNAHSAGRIVATLADLYCTDGSGQRKSEPVLAMVKEFIAAGERGVVTLGVTGAGEQYYEWKGTKCWWGEAAACILTASDISSWVAAKTKLQQESDSKTALLRFVSHELRTPTNAILNLVSNVQTSSNITPEQRSDLSIVLTSTHFLLSVINDLLDFSRIMADRFALVKQSFDVRHEVLDSVQLVELQCAQKGLFLTTKIDPFVPQSIYSDPNRFKQVLLNLLSNALKFTFKGGIRVICSVTARRTVRVTVKDSGIGIPAQQIPRLCKAFVTVPSTEKINPQGSGLGLYISSVLAKSLGGRPIHIESKEGVGSEFSFESYIEEEDEDAGEEGCRDTTTADIGEEREDEAPVSALPFIGGKGHSDATDCDVLIVDDCAFNRVVLQKLLNSFEVSADVAATGLRALSLIHQRLRRGLRYRLILMDVEMPEMDGIAATEEIRSLEHSGLLPGRTVIVACSAHRGEEDYDRCMRAGMDTFLEKPVSRSRLRVLLDSYLLSRSV